MRWLWEKRAYAGAAFGAYEVWVAVDWSLPGGTLAALRLGPAEYAGLITFGALCIAIVCAPFLNSLRPSKRFRAISDLIDTTMLRFTTDVINSANHKKPVFLSQTKATVREMAFSLDDLGVPYPSLTDLRDLDHWHLFFPRLLAASRAGKLKKAKTLLREIKSDE